MNKPPSQAPQPPERGLKMNELESNIESPISSSTTSGDLGVHKTPPLGGGAINLKPEHLKIVKEILFKFIPNTEVWAFGSRVKFTNAEFADLDLVIVAEKKQSLTTMADLEEAFKESDLPFEVDILDYCSIAEHLKKEINKKYMKLIDPKSVKKGYKDTPLGLIPEDWELVRLGDVCELLKDGTHGSHKDIDKDEGIALLSAKDVTDGNVSVPEGARFISKEDFDSIHRNYKIQSGDLLLTIVGTLGRIALVKEYKDNFTVQRSVAILRIKKQYLNLFFFHYFHGDHFQNTLTLKSNASAQAGVYLGELNKFIVPLPPLEEQKKIAEILSTWDQGIDKLSGLIERKKHLKKGLMQKLLTGRVRTPNPLKGGFKRLF
ncbi:MAG TPA: hypothetical protein DCM02_03185 [Flavobacterium sp.]|nr:hypothetical protein [Flavobacterium sp.]